MASNQTTIAAPLPELKLPLSIPKTCPTICTGCPVEVTPQVREVMWKDERECTPVEKFHRMAQHAGCSSNIFHFSKYVFIDIASTKTRAGGASQFELWPHIIDFVNALLTRDLVNLYKSRQIGASLAVAGLYIPWRCNFQKSTKVIYMSKGETEGAELLRKTKYTYLHLPPILRSPANVDNSMMMDFTHLGSRIDVFPSTESAGVSFTGSVIVWDEWEQHPYAEQNFLHAKPVIDGGGQIVGIWVRDPRKATSQARQVWLEGAVQEGPRSPEGIPRTKNGWTSVFYGWDVVPGRDQAWYDQVKRTTTINQLAGLDRETYMHCNYPKTWKEGLMAIGTMAAFLPAVQDSMQADVRLPLNSPKRGNPLVIEGLDANICHVYQGQSLGNYYIAFTDVGHGVGKDYSVTVIMNVKTGYVVGDICDNRISPEEFAYLSMALLRYFDSPLWFIEDNDWGRVVIDWVVNAKYRRIGYQDEKKTKPGFHTGGQGDESRTRVWGEYIPAFNNRQVVIPSELGLRMHGDVIRNSEAQGRIEAKSGGNDDYPWAMAGAWFKRKEVHAGQADPRAFAPLQTLHFAHERIKKEEEESPFAPVSALRW